MRARAERKRPDRGAAAAARDAPVSAARRPAPASFARQDISSVPLAAPVADRAPVVQRVLDIGGAWAASDLEAELIAALKTAAAAKSVPWSAGMETLVGEELASENIRHYPDVSALLDDLITADTSGSFAVAAKKTKRTSDEARALRQSVKFDRVYAENPSQPNPIATGFHDLPASKIIMPPRGIKIVNAAKKYRYMRSLAKTNDADFQVSTTGNPAAPGYIYTNKNQFAGNLDQFDTTGVWSRQKRDRDDSQMMGLGGQHKYPQHTVGHVAPFEHSPYVHDTADTSGATPTYTDTDRYEHNLVIENPTVGEQIKRVQVEGQMMKDKSYFMQYPVYPTIPVSIDTTYGSKPITAATKDPNGHPVVSKKRNRPEKLAFALDKGSGEEWAEFDNTGVTRYDIKESQRAKKGYDTRTADFTKWRGPRVRKGMKTAKVWQAEKKATPFPYVAPIYSPPTSIAAYDPDLEMEKTGVAGYMTPPRTPYYMGYAGPADEHEIKGWAMDGQTVVTTKGVKGIVIRLIDHDVEHNISTVELEPLPEVFS
jgi:hypothetical protein